MSARKMMRWVAAQPTRGAAYNWSEADTMVNSAFNAGVNLLAVLQQAPGWATISGATGNEPIKAADVQLAAEFCAAAVARYKNKVKDWEIWNEPDHNGWTAAQVKALLVAAYPLMKAADPNCNVVGICFSIAPTTKNRASVTDRWNALISDAAVRNAMDTCSYHMYNKMNPCPMPEENTYTAAGAHTLDPVPEETIKIMNWFSQRGFNKPIWCTEFGYPTEKPELNNWCTEENQARYLVRYVIPTIAAGVARTYQFQLFGYDTAVEAGGMGLWRPGNTQKKPGWFAWKTCADVIDGSSLVARVGTSTNPWVYEFQKDGKTGYVLWTQSGTANRTLTGLPATVKRTVVTNISTGVWQSTNVSTSGGSLAVTATIDPTYIEPL